MKPITGGTFDMGTSAGRSDELPVHAVTLTDFYIDSTEMTQLEFITMMQKYYQPFKLFGLLESVGIGDNYPMYNICWYDMILYCNARSKQEGYDTIYSYDSLSDTVGMNGKLFGVKIDFSKVGYRLPTEAEWEYACRAGTSTDFFWGEDSVDKYAWYLDNSDRLAHPVGQKLPNAFGLYDMSGNVYDFCNDWYASSYESGPKKDPHGPDTGASKIARGGNMIYDLAHLSSFLRMAIAPGVRYLYYGFRAVLPAPNGLSIKTNPIKSNKTPQSFETKKYFNLDLVKNSKFGKNTKSVLFYDISGKKLCSCLVNQNGYLIANNSLNNLQKGIYIYREIR